MTISTSFAGVSGVKIEIDADNIKSTFLDTDLSSVSSSDDTIASAKAIKSYVDSSGNVSMSSAAFNTSTGVLTLTKSDSSTITVDLDGKYQDSITFGISNTNVVKIDSSTVADDEYARFTANGLESRSTAEILSDIGITASTTELNYVDGVTSSIQTQLNSKVSSQWTTSGNNIYYDNENVGIGTTSPDTFLHVEGDSRGLYDASVGDGLSDPSNDDYGQLHIVSSTKYLNASSDDRVSRLKIGIDHRVGFGVGFIQGAVNDVSSNLNLSLCPKAGYVGIGTPSPTQKLHVKNITEENNDTYLLRFEQVNTASRWTALEVGQYYRATQGVAHPEPNSGTGTSTQDDQSAVWGINVRNENGSYSSWQNEGSILMLQSSGNGSVTVRKRQNNNYRFFVTGSSGGTTGWTNTSDDRLKYGESDIDSALDSINQLKTKKYEKLIYSQNDSGNWMPKDEDWESLKNLVDSDGNKLYEYVTELGFIAQEVKKIPELSFSVSGNEIDKNGNQTPLLLNYNNIFCLAIQAIQELNVKLKKIESRVSALEAA